MTASGVRSDGGWKAVRYFEQNLIGRDYIVSDVHGAYRLLLNALRSVRFEPARDRLFVNGDLVDRGIESLRASKLLDLPYVHALRGNHEENWIGIYDAFPGKSPPEDVVRAITYRLRMGAEWWFASAPQERDALVMKFRSLPVAMQVQTGRGPVGIVHADVPPGMSWGDFVVALERGDEVAMAYALESRKRLSRGDASGVPGVGRLFVGHTPQFDGPKRLGNVIAIDTGAIFGEQSEGQEPGRLTIATLVCKTEALAQPSAREDSLVDVCDQSADFGVPFTGFSRDVP